MLKAMMFDQEPDSKHSSEVNSLNATRPNSQRPDGPAKRNGTPSWQLLANGNDLPFAEQSDSNNVRLRMLEGTCQTILNRVQRMEKLAQRLRKNVCDREPHLDIMDRHKRSQELSITDRTPPSSPSMR